MTAVAAEDQAALETIVKQMEDAWNASDASGFTAPFADDGDQVNIFARQLSNREEIEAQHRHIFANVYRGSRNTIRVTDARYVTPDVALVRVHSVVEVPQGPLEGQVQTLATLIFRRAETRWELVTFHNTRIMPPPTR
jgi:uncharacterized protein (TIGR02246 family)